MSQQYRSAGVDIAAGDAASRLAYAHARATFGVRKGRMGEPVDIEGGFSGLLDMGTFCLTFNSDGVGTKALVAHRMGRYETLGYDLVAMVADDACCLGAEPTSMVNTLDIERVDPTVVDRLMGGLESAARDAGCAVVGGEVAEMPDAVRGLSWSASLIGVVQRERVLDGTAVRAGQHLVGLLTDNWRANGFSLVRRILENHFGTDWTDQTYDSRRTWGDVALEPSLIFTPLVCALTGGFDGAPTAALSGAAHITGGGLRHNVARVMPRGLKACWENLPPVPEPTIRLMELGRTPQEEAEQVWNMGVGMVLVTPDPEKCIETAEQMGYRASRIGRVVED